MRGDQLDLDVTAWSVRWLNTNYILDRQRYEGKTISVAMRDDGLLSVDQGVELKYSTTRLVDLAGVNQSVNQLDFRRAMHELNQYTMEQWMQQVLYEHYARPVLGEAWIGNDETVVLFAEI